MTDIENPKETVLVKDPDPSICATIEDLFKRYRQNKMLLDADRTVVDYISKEIKVSIGCLCRTCIEGGGSLAEWYYGSIPNPSD